MIKFRVIIRISPCHCQSIILTDFLFTAITARVVFITTRTIITTDVVLGNFFQLNKMKMGSSLIF